MKQTGRIHAASLEGSQRLRTVLGFLRARGSQGATTREIIESTGYCAINSIVAEIRECGVTVTCTPEGRSPSGGMVYRYRCEVARPVQGQLFSA